MELVNYRITLDVLKNGVQKTLQGFNTGDAYARRIEVSLVRGSELFELTDNLVASMYVKHEDAEEPSINACEIIGNKVIYNILPTDISSEGIVSMQLKIIEVKDDISKVLVSPRFELAVWDAITDDSEAEKTTVYTALEEALAEAKRFKDKTVVSVIVDEDYLFIVTFGDGSQYTSTVIQDAMKDISSVAEYVEEAKEAAETATTAEAIAAEKATAASTSATEAEASKQYIIDHRDELKGEPGVIYKETEPTLPEERVGVWINPQGTFEPIQIGGGADIDDGVIATDKTWSSSKIDSFKSEFVTPNNVKTINGQSIIGKGNIVIQGGSGGDSNLVIVGTNIADLPNKIEGKYVSSGVGGAFKEATNADYGYIKFDVEPNTWYTMNNRNCAGNSFTMFFGADDKCIDRFTDIKNNANRYILGKNDRLYFKTPANATYMAVSQTLTWLNRIIVVKGLVSTLDSTVSVNDYPFGSTIYERLVPNVSIDGRMNYVYVAPYGDDAYGDGTEGNPFATIYHANETIKDNSKNKPYTIIVKQGTYTDLQTRFSGVRATTYQGIFCKDYVYYESEDTSRPDLCIIEWDGADGFTNPVSDDIFGKCPFHIITAYNSSAFPSVIHTHIKGFKFVCANTRYAGHIELQGASDGVECLIENCDFVFNGRDAISNPTASAGYFAFGCGGSPNANIAFKGCNFVSNGTKAENSAWYIHDGNATISSPYKYGCNVLLEKCNFNNQRIATQTSRDGGYITPCTVTVRNCSTPSEYKQTVASGKTEVWKLIKEGTNATD